MSKKLILAILIILVFFLFSCTSIWEKLENTPPIANAGEDLFCSCGENITLNADNSEDLDGDKLVYKWTIRGETYIGKEISINFNSQGVYWGFLEVTDGMASDIDSIVITVESKEEVIEETTENVIETPQENYFENINEILKFEAEEGMFPDYWYIGEEINPKAESLSPAEIERSKEVMGKALKKYPDILLSENLTKLYVLGYLECFGVPYGGTASPYNGGLVYIVNGGLEMGYDNYWLEQTFHSEFSHVLYEKYTNLFKEDEWKNNNPEDFEYFYDFGAEALQSETASLEFDPKLYEKGFLFQYAQATLEEDMASIAENLFLNDGTFWDIYNQYPRIKAKADLLIEFYNTLNKTFTKEYFFEISKE